VALLFVEVGQPCYSVSFEMRNSALHTGRSEWLLSGNDIGSMGSSIMLKRTFCITHFSKTQQQHQQQQQQQSIL